MVTINQNQKACACGPFAAENRGCGRKDFRVYQAPERPVYFRHGPDDQPAFQSSGGYLKPQIVQKSLDKVILRIVKNDDFDDNSIRILKEEFGKLTGDGVNIEFEFPDKISREKSGKYRPGNFRSD